MSTLPSLVTEAGSHWGVGVLSTILPLGTMDGKFLTLWWWPTMRTEGSKVITDCGGIVNITTLGNRQW